MTATTVQIAKQLKTLISAAPFSESIVVNRDYTAFYSIEDINATLSLSIMPRATANEIQAKGGEYAQHDYDTDIGIYEHIEASGAERDARVDELMAIVEEVADFIQKIEVTVDGETHFPAAIANEPIFDYEALKDAGVFRSLITVGFSMVRGGTP